MRFKNGWIKLHRSLLDSDIGSNHNRFLIFITLLLWATIKETKVEWSGKPLLLKPGCVLTSLKELANRFDLDPRTVKKHLLYLQMRSTLVLYTNNQGSLIKINNFQRYQDVPKGMQNAMQNDVQNGMQNGVLLIEELKNKRTKEQKVETSFQQLNVDNNSKLKTASEENAPCDFLLNEDPPKLAPPPPKFPRLVEIWNEHRKYPMPKVTKMTDEERLKKCRKAWGKNPDEEYWISVIKRMNGSSFFLGENERGFKGSFDFMIRKDEKILEGQYDSKSERKTINTIPIKID